MTFEKKRSVAEAMLYGDLKPIIDAWGIAAPLEAIQGIVEEMTAETEENSVKLALWHVAKRIEVAAKQAEAAE